jgi:hypothetical protein
MKYTDPGAAYYEERYRQRVLSNLQRRARAFGYAIGRSGGRTAIREVSKLAGTAVVDAGADFASRLERAMRRSAKVIEARAKPTHPRLIDLRLAPPVPDRRFRR